jgi:CxxC-x17-CxxC domain-containing protein
MGIFTKIWAGVWSARMEYILNNCILALLDTPDTTLLGILRILVDKDYRQKIIGNLKDPVIKAFWIHEYEEWQDKFRNEAIAPIQNKVGQFLSTSIVRNIVGQAKSTINVFDIMNQGKIFLVNVSKGRIGEDNSSLLGGMLITKIQLAAMERVRIPEEERKDFYLYVDEFQNFVTEAFAGILSEARKYRLNLTIAHQYTAQLISDKNSSVRDSVFGNVGTMIVFRVGADDADFLEKEFEPEFMVQDIVNLPNYKIYLKLMIDGVTSRPFSAKTILPIAKVNLKIRDEVIESSRKLYCRPREVVEGEINKWSGVVDNDNKKGDSYSGGEKFAAICSSCKKETSIPFKPIPGRPVYCWDCMEKIKSGEIKPIRGAVKSMESSKENFFQPLADLGIEFKSSVIMPTKVPVKVQPLQSRVFRKSDLSGTPGSLTYPKTGTASSPYSQNSKPPLKTNSGLKEILEKTLNKIKTTVNPQSVSQGQTLGIQKGLTLGNESSNLTPQVIKKIEPISLGTLTIPQIQPQPFKDKSATTEEMNKLKNLIEQKKIMPQSSNLTPQNVQEEKIIPKEIKSSPTDNKKIKEVPEDILRKILE